MTMPNQHIVKVLRWIGALGIVTIAVMRSLIVFAPQVYFDVDPAFDPAPFAGMGMAGSLALDAALLLFASIAFLGEWLGGRTLELKLVLLALVPVPIVLWHGWCDAGDLWRGSTWAAAAIAAVAVAHLARDAMMRIIIAALLLAIIAPLLMRGGAQVTFEHAETIAEFERNREAFLRDRGWEEGSSQALIFERRLRQPQPRGWFTTTNIFASIVGAAAVVFVGLAVGCHRARLPSGWMGLSVFIALVAAGGVWMSGSRGAMLAMLLGGFVCLAPLLVARFKPWLQRMGGVLFLLLPFAALAGVVARGVLLPEDFLNEKSLLFRWHYFVSSFGVFSDQPLLGTGPDQFQEAYVQHRLPRNPEEVVSAHSVFIDWLCMLGIFASAWVALALIMLKRAGSQLREQAAYLTGDDVETLMGSIAKCVLVVLLLGVIPAIMVELHVLDVVSFLPRAFGAVGYVALAMMLGFVMITVDRLIAYWSIAASVLVLVVHGQIEMTFFQPNAVVWLMCMLGVLAGHVETSRCQNVKVSGGLVDGRIVGAICAGLAIWIGVTGWIPATLQHREIRAAAEMLHPPPQTLREMMRLRMEASQRLLDAYERWPRNSLPLHHAARQMEVAAARATAEERIEMLRQAVAIATRAVDEHDRSSSYALRAVLAAQLANMTAEPVDWDRAIADARTVTQRDPRGLSAWRQLGDLLWFAGRESEAIDAYRRALEIDADFELDPLKQLSPQRRDQIEQRVRPAE